VLKVMKNFLLLFFSFLIFPYNGFAEDTLTITTYYPSPYGVYRELRAKRMAIGDDYTSGTNYTWQETASGAGEIDYAADLVVEGNVGIGTVNPNTNLHIKGADSAAYGQLEIQSTGYDAGMEFYNSNGATTTGRGGLMMSGYPGYEGLRFRINQTDKMIIDENGNVGIGTTAPGTLLQIGGGTGSLHVLTPGLLLKNSTSYERSIMEIHDPTGANRLVIQTLADSFYIASLDSKPLLLQTSGGNVGINMVPSYKLDVSGDIRAAAGGDFVIGPALSGSDVHLFSDSGEFSVYTNGARRFAINTAGDTVIYGDDDWALYGDNGYPVLYWSKSTANHMGMGGGASASYTLLVSGSLAYYGGGNISDARLKKNVTTIDDPLTKIMALRGVYFEWDKTKTDIKDLKSSRNIGLIAQEVKKVVPEVVDGKGKDYMSIEYGALAGLIVEGMKAQQKQIAQQQKQIEDLSREIKLLKNKKS